MARRETSVQSPRIMASFLLGLHPLICLSADKVSSRVFVSCDEISSTGKRAAVYPEAFLPSQPSSQALFQGIQPKVFDRDALFARGADFAATFSSSASSRGWKPSFPQNLTDRSRSLTLIPMCVYALSSNTNFPAQVITRGRHYTGR